MSSNEFIAIEDTVAVQAPICKVYDRWNRVEEFPKFMEGVKSIVWENDRSFRLVSEANGQLFESECEVTLRIPERRIAWRTLKGPDSSGVVCFQNIGNGRTEVTLKMRYNPADGWTSADEVKSRLQRNLRRFKDLAEKEVDLPSSV